MLPRLHGSAACFVALVGLTLALPVLAQEPPSPPATAPEAQPAPSTTPPPSTPPSQADQAPSAAPEASKRHHALSLVGEPKYQAGFSHFDWVNPDAP